MLPDTGFMMMHPTAAVKELWRAVENEDGSDWDEEEIVNAFISHLGSDILMSKIMRPLPRILFANAETILSGRLCERWNIYPLVARLDFRDQTRIEPTLRMLNLWALRDND
jgi:hypothetical protein